MSTNHRNDPKYTTPVYPMVHSLAPCGVEGWGASLYINGRCNIVGSMTPCGIVDHTFASKLEAEAAVRAEALARGLAIDVIHDRSMKSTTVA